MAATSTLPEDAACCRIGVIADVQWCDIEDGWNFKRTERRAYRGALEAFRRAGEWWNRGPALHAVAQLGDLIDGQCKKHHISEACLAKALLVLEGLKAPRVLNLIGNHELYNFSYDELAEKLGTRRDGREFYAWVPAPGVRLLALHSYELAIIGREKSHPAYTAAMEILKAHNPNDLESGCDFKAGLEGLEHRFVPYNGAFGKDQLLWFEEQLREAEAQSEKVIVLSHTLLHPPLLRSDTDNPSTMAFDYEDFANAIAARPGIVVAVFAGHDHTGGYNCVDGVHHITFQSPLNKGAEGFAFGRADVYHDRLEIRGVRLEDILHVTALEHSERLPDGLGEQGAAFHFPKGVAGGTATNGAERQRQPIIEAL